MEMASPDDLAGRTLSCPRCSTVRQRTYNLRLLFAEGRLRLLLAPMEGLLDDVLRDVVTRVGPYDWAVSEFMRVSGTLLPHRFYRRTCPELQAGGRTAAGIPVRVQLLGSDPGSMAENAAHLVELTPPGIDLNFGCPAPTVNRHRGGAALLDEPELLWQIAASVRRVVPRTIPFTAKMRLGIADPSRATECAQALADGGVEQIVVHARTKADAYRPPAHWEWVGRIAEAVPLPVVANGEIWNEADWLRCRAVSGVADVMLGRGAVADPFLAGRLRRHGAAAAALMPPDRQAEWEALRGLLSLFWRRVRRKVAPRFAPGRLKQWLNLLRRNFPQAERLFQEIRAMRHVDEIESVLRRHGIAVFTEALAA